MSYRRDKGGQVLVQRAMTQSDQVYEPKVLNSLDFGRERIQKKTQDVDDELQDVFKSWNDQNPQPEVINSNQFQFSNQQSVKQRECQQTNQANDKMTQKYFVPLYRLAPQASKVPLPQFLMNGSL